MKIKAATEAAQAEPTLPGHGAIGCRGGFRRHEPCPGPPPGLGIAAAGQILGESSLMTSAISPRHDSPVADLVMQAKDGDQRAWDALVERYAPLVWSICSRYQLDRADSDDVRQSVWLALLGQLGSIRDPAALPGWLATTASRECAKTVRETRRLHSAGRMLEAESMPDTQAATAEQELVRAERHAALREAFADLPPHSQRLIALLIEDPPLSYAEISARLGIPIGSIGPTRRRCLQKLRQHPAIAALRDAGQGERGGKNIAA